MKILKHTFKIKPLSANQMTYRNKAIKQIKYIQYQNELRAQLLGVAWPFEDSDLLEFEIIAGVSNKMADLDNVVKPVLDTYQYIFEKFKFRGTGRGSFISRVFSTCFVCFCVWLAQSKEKQH